jgi:hypothetical protein
LPTGALFSAATFVRLFSKLAAAGHDGTKVFHVGEGYPWISAEEGEPPRALGRTEPLGPPDLPLPPVQPYTLMAPNLAQAQAWVEPPEPPKVPYPPAHAEPLEAPPQPSR